MSILSSIGDTFNNLFKTSSNSTKPNPLANINQTTNFPSPISASPTPVAPPVTYAKPGFTPMPTPAPVAPAPISTKAPAPTTPTPTPTPTQPNPYQASVTNDVNLNNQISTLQNQMRTTGLNTPVPSTISSAAVNPDNNRSSLLSTADELRKKLISSIGGSPESLDAKKRLAAVRNEATDRKLKYDADIAEAKKNAGGVFGGVLNQEINKLTEDYKKDIDRLGLTEQNALAEVGLYKDETSQIMDTIKLITDSTNSEIVGSIQTDKMTGNVYGYFRDPLTGQVSQQMLGTVSPEGPDINQMTDNERAYFTQFRSEPIVKAYNEVVSQKLNIDNIINQGVGGPADLAMVFSFMKGLDPSSVVREAEYDTASKSGNIFQGAFAKFNGYFKPTGGFLPENVKKEFQNLVNLKLQAQKTQYDNVANEYRATSARQGLNPDNVVLNYSGALTSGGNPGGNIVQTAAGAIPTDW